MRHSFKDWLFVTRFWSFAVSAMPVVVTYAYLCSINKSAFDAPTLLRVALAVIATIVLHAAGNVLSDWYDYKKGVDNEQAFAVDNLVYHKFQPKEYLVFSIALFVLGMALGFILVALCGIPVLVIGGIGVLLTALYSFFKFNALGDLDIFIIFSILIMLGTSQVACGAIVWDVLILAIPVGLITVSVLHANNTVDIESDSQAGISTFAMVIGGRISSILYMVYMVIPFLFIVCAVVAGCISPFALLCIGAMPLAIMNARQAMCFGRDGIKAMMGLDQASAKLQMAFSGLLTVGLVVASFI